MDTAVRERKRRPHSHLGLKDGTSKYLLQLVMADQERTCWNWERDRLDQRGVASNPLTIPQSHSTLRGDLPYRCQMREDEAQDIKNN